MAKKYKMESIRIKDGLFFVEDFEKLPKDVIIFIKDGLLMKDETKK